MMAEFESTKFFSFSLFADDLAKIGERLYSGDRTSGNRILVNTINPHSFYVADRDPLFKTALENCDVLLPDGIGVVMANNLMNKRKISKIAGMDIFMYLLRVINHSSSISNKRIFFLGSSDETLERIKSNIERDYDDLEIAFFAPPFKLEFSKDDTDQMILNVNIFDPLVLFVGMTAPKQEKWAFQNLGRINATAICCIGAVFDFYSGKIQRPGKVWQFLGLEWLKRFSGEPKRLWRRNLISSPYFLYKVVSKCLLQLYGQKKWVESGSNKPS